MRKTSCTLVAGFLALSGSGFLLLSGAGAAQAAPAGAPAPAICTQLLAASKSYTATLKANEKKFETDTKAYLAAVDNYGSEVTRITSAGSPALQSAAKTYVTDLETEEAHFDINQARLNTDDDRMAVLACTPSGRSAHGRRQFRRPAGSRPVRRGRGRRPGRPRDRRPSTRAPVGHGPAWNDCLVEAADSGARRRRGAGRGRGERARARGRGPAARSPAGPGAGRRSRPRPRQTVTPARPRASHGVPCPRPPKAREFRGLSWRRSPPVSISIPAIGVTSRLMYVGLNPDGTIQVPPAQRPAAHQRGGLV